MSTPSFLGCRPFVNPPHPLHRPCFPYPFIHSSGPRLRRNFSVLPTSPLPFSLHFPPTLIRRRIRSSPEDGSPLLIRQVECAALHEETAGITTSADFVRWDAFTSRLSGSATLAFLMLQLPQIVLNSQNLINGNSIALFAVQWRGQLTSLLGNLCLLSYFAKKRETGAMVVQAVGVISTWVVLLQLSVAGAMPSSSFSATTTAVGLGLLLNSLNLKGLLSSQIWEIWEDAITIGSVSVLPQVMWSTFEPLLPQSRWPGVSALVIASTLIILKRLHKLPSNAIKFLNAVSAWTATLLFMWGPVAQMWTNYLNPENIRGLSVFTVLLAMIGNALLLPRALFTRDNMWFTGASWGAILQGWGILITMYINKCIAEGIFWGTTAVLLFWLGFILAKDSNAYSLSSPFTPLVQLYFGKDNPVSTESDTN